MAERVSLLDLVQVHHDVLRDVLRTAAEDDLHDLLTAAAGFLVEALGSAEMAQRGFLETATPLGRRHVTAEVTHGGSRAATSQPPT
jgi:hypothetical protein